jgi:hypothetical protein
MNNAHPPQATDESMRLRAMLEADIGPDAADAYLKTVEDIRALPTPAPTAAERARLLTRLQAAIPPAPGPAHPLLAAPMRPSPDWRWLLDIVDSQRRVVQDELWWASGLVLVLGLIVTLIMAAGPSGPSDLPLVILAPIVAAVGVAMLHGGDIEGALEIERATPIRPAALLLARLALVFGFDLLLGLIASGAAALLTPGLSLLPLIGAWLAPMLFLSALAFLISVATSEPLAAALFSFALWVAFVGTRIWNTSLSAYFQISIPDLTGTGVRLWLALSALPVFALALYLSNAASQERQPHHD